ncbi:MAG: DapH/DapD/GlmU-related protein [Cyclobacteriaceae bacterium]
MDISSYIEKCYARFPQLRRYRYPWDITSGLEDLILQVLAGLSDEGFKIKKNVAIHRSAIIEGNVTLKEHTIIGANSIVKAGAYLRSGVLLGNEVTIGANCEIKQSMVFDKSRVAHLNYVGNSIIGEDVNLEAGSILANHFNERHNKNILTLIDNSIVDTNITKFGSLIGDRCRIGANAVLNPGTILKCDSVVGRLVHLDQLKEKKA